MKTVTIIIDQVEGETQSSHDLECLATVNGRYYHDCLRNICEILVTYEKCNKNMHPEGLRVLRDIRRKAAKHFGGVHHGK